MDAVQIVPPTLLPGRYPVELDWIKQNYVEAAEFQDSKTRSIIWDNFISSTEQLRSIIPIAWVWISGSFISAKLDPDDIDVVYWGTTDLSQNTLSLNERFILQIFAENKLRKLTGLRVDTRYCRWFVNPSTGDVRSLEHDLYLQSRGFWDDFWLRARTNAKGEPGDLSDAYPKRGYLEVMLDGI